MKKRSSLLRDSLKFCHFWPRIYFCFQTSGSGNWTGQLEAAALNPTKKLWVEKLENCFSSPLTLRQNKLWCLSLAIFLDLRKAREYLTKGKAQYSWPLKVACFGKENNICGIKSSWSELVCTRRSTVLSLPLHWGFPDAYTNLSHSRFKTCHVEEYGHSSILCRIYYSNEFHRGQI
jgi:hypothetical protein